MKKHSILAALLGVAAAVGLTACGSEQTGPDPAATGEITVSDAWVRATAGTTDPSMTAAFMAIANGTPEDVRLVSASSPVSEMVQIHEMVMADDGTTLMQEAPDGVTVRAGKEQLLMPGGFHVMLMGLTDEIAPGDEVAFTLTFSDGTTLEVSAPAKEFTEEKGHYHASGSPSPSMQGEDSGSASP
ncbi:MAG: copper chaperone PCu(A)C [Nocardioidaceae bacterium]